MRPWPVQSSCQPIGWVSSRNPSLFLVEELVREKHEGKHAEGKHAEDDEDLDQGRRIERADSAEGGGRLGEGVSQGRVAGEIGSREGGQEQPDALAEDAQHHENEIAQSECCNGVPFARYWLHNAFLNIDNRKMSKSLGNFFTVREISEKFDLQVLRLFMLSAHYRSPLNFSEELMQSAASSLERIRNAADNLAYLAGQSAAEALTPEESALQEEAKAFEAQFREAMDDDLNTADALAAVFELVKFANTHASEGSSRAFLDALSSQIVRLCDVLGLNVAHKEETLDTQIEALIEERQAARKARDFAKADAIRDQLKAMGIELLDTKEGVKWKKI